MSGFAQRWAADLRLAILQVLHEDTGEQNDLILATWLERIGHTPGTQQLRDEMAWLAEQRCLKLAPLGSSGAVKASLTTKGADVARGRVTIPGILRPDPA